MRKISNIYKEVMVFCRKRGLIKKLEQSFTVPESERFKSLNVAQGGLDVLDAVHCLYDKKRTDFFMKEIYKNVSSGDIVLEAGIGTGILSFCAASLGAKVYGCELNPAVFKLAQEIKKHLEKKGLIPPTVEFYLEDATTFVPPQKGDVVISENIYTGMFFEYQVQIMNHLVKFLSPSGVCIPQKIRSFISFAQVDFPRPPKNKELFIPSEEKDFEVKYKLLTKPYQYDEIDFTKKSDLFVDNLKSSLVKRGGRVNGMVIYSEVVLLSGKVIGKDDTTFLNNEIIVAVQPQIKVEKGDCLRLKLRHQYGSKPDDLKFSIKKQK